MDEITSPSIPSNSTALTLEGEASESYWGCQESHGFSSIFWCHSCVTLL